jgi:outer membrane receptor protein involved in Fe transport
MASSKAWPIVLVLTIGSGQAQAQADPAKPPPPAKPAAKIKSPEAKTVEGLTVTGAAPDTQTQIDRRSYTLGKDLQATTGSIADALRNVPSVDVDLQGALSLRGDSNVTILVDGKPSPAFEGAGRADALQQLPADQIERVEVITNPSAALNPEGTGGVINLITKKSRGAGVTGSAYVTAGSAGLKRAGASFGYNSNKLSVTGSLSGNYQRNKNEGHDRRNSLDPASGQFLDHTDDFIGRNIARGPTAQLTVGYAATSKDQLSASANYNELLVYGHPIDRYADFGADGSRTGVLIRRAHRRFEEIDFGLTAGWKHTFGDGHDLSVDVVQNESRPRNNPVTTTVLSVPASPFALESVRDDATQKHSELKVAYARPMPGGGSLKAGFELKYDDNDFNFSDSRGAGATTLSPVAALANHFTFKQTAGAGYATYERTFGDLGVQGGLRLEHVSFDLDQLTSGQTASQDYTRLYPSLHLSYKLNDEDRLTASVSHRVQRPPPPLLNPLIYTLDPRTTQQGNPDLKPKDTQSFELGYEHHQGSTSYQATLFYRDNKGEISQVLLDRGGGVVEFTFLNEGSSRVAGLEMVASGKLGQTLTYNATATPYWAQVNPGDPTLGQTRSKFGLNGRANLNWQARPNDLFQLNANGRGRIISAQGTFEPFWTLNLGWRHKVNDRITVTLTVQDLLETNRFVRLLDTPILHDHFVVEPVSRAYFLRLDYRFGGGKKPAKDPNFEYENGGPPQP